MVIYIIIFYSQELWKWYVFKQESDACLCWYFAKYIASQNS